MQGVADSSSAVSTIVKNEPFLRFVFVLLFYSLSQHFDTVFKRQIFSENARRSRNENIYTRFAHFFGILKADVAVCLYFDIIMYNLCTVRELDAVVCNTEIPPQWKTKAE